MNPRHLAIVALALVACSDTPTACPAWPCPQGLAVEVTLTGSPVGTPLTTASVHLPNVTPDAPCNEGAQKNVCRIAGGVGSYTFTISAMFYETVTRTVVVTGHRVGCNCPTVDTQRITVAMSPTS